MAKYRVKPGCHHGSWIAEGVHQYGPGDIVELDPEAAAGFLDKLELVEEPPALPAPDAARADAARKDAAAHAGPELVTTVKPRPAARPRPKTTKGSS
jgi:hypothetical protein